MSYTTVAMI